MKHLVLLGVLSGKVVCISEQLQLTAGFCAGLNSAGRRDQPQHCHCKRKWQSQEATGKRTFEVRAETVSAGDGCHRQ